MILSDRDLFNAIRSGDLVIDPYEPELVQPASIDVRLDRFFRVFPTWHVGFMSGPVDPSREPLDGEIPLTEVPDGDSFLLSPLQFALGSTLEAVRLSADLCARIEGKSSLGRLGLFVHSTAGFVDPGFVGTLTLELTNVAPYPIRLWPGMKIGQLCVMRLTSPAQMPYGLNTGAHYQNQRGPVESRSWERWQVWPTRES